jgi:CO dehydrogenase maturation factor
MKIAISGKGGVGKTTLSAMLAAAPALRGRHVIAIDADPDANLASALGLGEDEQPRPLSEMGDLIAERTGAKDGGGYFKLNPKVDDIPETYAARIGDIRLLVLGGVSKGGGGCICPATTLLKALLIHLVLGRDEALVMDMEAGIEHLGRATAQSMDALLVVVDASPWSVHTAQRVRKLAGDIAMPNIFAVANRVDREAQLNDIAGQLGEIPLIGHLPTDNRLAAGVARVSPEGRLEPAEALADHLPAVERIISEVKRRT